jgi:hypothetical protein
MERECARRIRQEKERIRQEICPSFEAETAKAAQAKVVQWKLVREESHRRNLRKRFRLGLASFRNSCELSAIRSSPISSSRPVWI